MYQTANDDYLLLNTAGASRNERRRGREPHRERMRIGVAGNYYDQGKKGEERPTGNPSQGQEKRRKDKLKERKPSPLSKSRLPTLMPARHASLITCKT